MKHKNILKWLEWHIGAYAFQLVGIATFLFGVGFFFKYAFDHGWLYATGIVSIFFAFTLMGALISWLYDNRFIALCSIIGGFIIPVIVKANPVLVIIYIFSLGIIFFALSYARNWPWLNYISLIGYISVYHAQVTRWSAVTTFYFISSLWLIFTILPFVYACMIKKERLHESIIIALTALLSFIYYYNLSFKGVLAHTEFLSVIFYHIFSKIEVMTFVFSALYSLLALIIFTVNKQQMILASICSLLALFFCLLGIIITFSFFYANTLIFTAGMIVFIVSFLLKKSWMRLVSYGIWVLNVLYLALLLFPGKSTYFATQYVTLSLLIMIGCLCAALFFIHTYNAQLESYEKRLSDIITGLIICIPIYWMHTPLWHWPLSAIGLLLYALLLFVLGLYMRYVLMRSIAYACALLSIFHFLFLYIYENLVNPFWFLRLNILFVAYISIFLCARLMLTFLKKFKLPTLEEKYVRMWLDALLALSIVGWIRANIIINFDHLSMHGSFFAKRLMGYSMQYDYLQRAAITNVLLTLLYIVYAVILISIGLWQYNFIMRYLGFGIMSIGILKLIMLILVMPNTILRIIALLIIGIALISASYIYQRNYKGIK